MQELENANKWYFDYYDSGAVGFETYERDYYAKVVTSERINRLGHVNIGRAEAGQGARPGVGAGGGPEGGWRVG